MSLLEQLKRRHVFQVAAVYAVTAVGVVGAADAFAEGLSLPGWFLSVVTSLAILGLPVALVLAWAYQLTPEGLRRDRASGNTNPAPCTIAALPFVNLSGDPANEYFSDGMTDEILTRLSQVSELHVISHTSVLRYRGTTLPLRTIAAELGVANLLEGRVQRAGNRVRITAQLIEAATDTHLWAETYDRDLADIFEVQAEVAGSIALALKARITDPERYRMARRYTSDMEAYDLYLRGLALTARAGSANLERAVELYRLAIARDPRFALAYCGLASAYLFQPFWGRVRPVLVLTPAWEAVQRAISLDPDLPDAYGARATLHLFGAHDMAAAAADSARALALQPGPWPLQGVAARYLVSERYDEALSCIDRALRFDPNSPLFLSYRALILGYRGDPADAEQVARRVIELAPDFGIGHYYLAQQLRALGRREEALHHCELARRLLGDHELPIGTMAVTFAQDGDMERAWDCYHELQSRREREWIDPFAIAGAALAVGREEEALAELERAFAEKSFYALLVRPASGPGFAFSALRQHPRLRRLLHGVWPQDFPLPPAAPAMAGTQT